MLNTNVSFSSHERVFASVKFCAIDAQNFTLVLASY